MDPVLTFSFFLNKYFKIVADPMVQYAIEFKKCTFGPGLWLISLITRPFPKK